MSKELKQIVVPIENAPDRLLEVTKALGQAGINLRALNLVDTDALGQLRISVSDVAKARRILMKSQIPAFVNQVVALEIENTPGSLAKALEPTNQAGLNLKFMYAHNVGNNGNAVMIMSFNDNDKAIEVLSDKGYHILDTEAFGIIEKENACKMAA